GQRQSGVLAASEAAGSGGHRHHAGGRRGLPQPGDALLRRQGLGCDAAHRPEGLLSRSPALSLAARGHRLEVPGDDRLPRPDRGRARVGLDRPRQQGRGAARHRPFRLRLRPVHAGDEDRSPEAGAGRARLRCRLRRGPAGRGEKPREGARFLLPRRRPRLGSAQPAAGTMGALQHAPPTGGVVPRLPALQLDRTRRVGLRAGRGRAGGAALPRPAAAGGTPRRNLDHGGRRAPAARARGSARDALRPISHARLLSPLGCDREPGRNLGGCGRRDARCPHLGAPGALDRLRRGSRDGKEEARRLLL
ncbi:MAG: Sulfate adenylyltransferase subunit 2, partial [uncultured Acetobacteraceae bacterium]